MKEKKTFESALLELEKIVHTMEEGNVGLEQSISLYKQGFELTQFCYKKLEEAQLVIEELKPEALAPKEDVSEDA